MERWIIQKYCYKPGSFFHVAAERIEGANDVSQAIEDLDALRRLDALTDGAQRELVAKLLARLQKSLEDFDAREAKLVEVLVENGKK